jgi:hypothetical protein
VRRTALLPLLLAAALLAPRAAAAQDADPLAGFVATVARLWAAGDADALVALAPSDGRILLDVLGEGPGEVHPRNAAAALRRLFSELETASVRSARATLVGGSPGRGFGELAWTTRARGVRESVQSTVYVGMVREDRGWRIRELRVLR